MSPEVKEEFARMLAARKRLLDLRSSRIEQLIRVRVAIRSLLADFFETLDPIANVRLAEVSADGSKSNGVLAITLAFFEGTRMQLSVDTTGRFHHAISIPSAFDDVARMLEIGFSSDMSRIEVLYESIEGKGEQRRLDLIAVVLALLSHAVATVEAEAGVAPAPIEVPTLARVVRAPAEPAATAANLAAPAAPAASRLGVGGRVAAALPAEAPSLRLTLAPVAPPNADVLTFNVG